MSDDRTQTCIFTTIQTFLKSPPVIIWGSGATVSFGLPTMERLNDVLKKNVRGFNKSNENLETELGKSKYNDNISEIRKLIWDAVNEENSQVLRDIVSGNSDSLDCVKDLIEKFRETHPKVVNIITTNYDCVLEYVMAYHDIPYTDGFEGKELSIFNSQLFQKKNIVNLVKVHGSLNWFQIGSSNRYLKQKIENTDPIIICPGINKYQEAHKPPYRDLIQKADELITNASSFLVIGFGFNDQHLTPKIKEKVESGTPLVLITKGVTEYCKSELQNAQKYILLQEGDVDNTSVFIKSSKDSCVEEATLSGDYWKLEKFMEIV